MKKVFFIIIIAFLLFSGCPNDTLNSDLTVIAGFDFTALLDIPRNEVMFQETIIEQPEFTSVVAWSYSLNGSIFWRVGENDEFFEEGLFYRATITLSANEGYTFINTLENSFTHLYGSAVNPGGTSETLRVIITFPKTPASNDRIVTSTNLDTVFFAPTKGELPITEFVTHQYTGFIRWLTEDEQNFNLAFEPNTQYRANVIINPVQGFTLAGLLSNSFNFPGVKDVKFNLINTVTVTFDPTPDKNSDTIVNRYNLDNLFLWPAAGETPKQFFNSLQYEGEAEWFYIDEMGETPISGTLDRINVPIKAVIKLTAKEGFTFDGVPANVFSFSGSGNTRNAAGGNIVTVSFSREWRLGSLIPVTYPSMAHFRIEACCWYGINFPGVLLLDNNSYWDYGWHTTGPNFEDNFSSWKSLMAPAGVQFSNIECVNGHPNVFNNPSKMPDGREPSLVRKAHAITLDLGFVMHNIGRIRLHARADEGRRFPWEFDIYYSDEYIGAYPHENAVFAGTYITTTAPANNTWVNFDLYPNIPGKRGISAQYIHIRMHRTRDTVTSGTNIGNNIEASFNRIGIGIGQ